MVPFQAEKGKNSSTKCNISEKGQKSSTKNGTISVRKGSKFLDKECTISEKGQNSSAKMVQFQERVKHRQQKWYHFRKGSKIVNENGTILVRKGSKFLNKNGTISKKGQKSSTKMVPFQKRVKNPQQKWYHFRKGSKILTEMVKIPQQNGTISGSKGSKFLNKNGIISEKGQKF